MKNTLLFWDWNGTLMNDLSITLDAVNAVLCRRNMKPISLCQYYSYLDTPIWKFYAHLFDFNKVPFNVISQEFFDNYTLWEKDAGLADGIPALLSSLHYAGMQQAVLTSAATEDVERLLRYYGIRDIFVTVSGSDDRLSGSKIERGKTLIQSFPPQSAVMIGDSLHDLATARAMGTDCILVNWGHQNPEELILSGVPVANTCSDLAALLGV